MIVIYLPGRSFKVDSLTPGKEYVVEKRNNDLYPKLLSLRKSSYLILNDNGTFVYYKKIMFKEKSEIREEKLNKLGI